MGGSDGVPSDHTEDDWSRGSAEDPDLEIDGQNEARVVVESANSLTELDRKVCKYFSLQRKTRGGYARTFR